MVCETSWIQRRHGGPLVFDGVASAGLTVFAYFPEDIKYFVENSQRAMVNFCVDNLDELLEKLASEQLSIDPS